jgi:hypothetical protein
MGGLASPWVELLPPFELKCTLTVKNSCPLGVVHAATSGLRELFQALLVGSMRPGLKLQEEDYHEEDTFNYVYMDGLYLRTGCFGPCFLPVTTFVLSREPPAGDPGTRLSLSGR